MGNLTTADGVLAPPELVRKIGIGTRVRMVFTDIAPGLALPQWTFDQPAAQPAWVWRYPGDQCTRGRAVRSVSLSASVGSRGLGAELYEFRLPVTIRR